MCLMPLTINGNQVPCGRCYECLQASRSEWMYRNLVERSYHNYSYFITLTYDDYNVNLLEQNFEVGLHFENKEHRVNFFKNLRNVYGKESIRYYGCFEFGDNTYRPHYHFILYSDIELSKETIEKCWSKGLVDVQKSRTEAIHYVSGYLQKPMRRFNNKEEYLRYIYRDNPHKLYKSLFNFHLYHNTKKYMSTHPAIGHALLDDNAMVSWIRQYTLEHQHYPRLGFYGREYKLPRFYIKKIFSDDERQLIYNKGLENQYESDKKIVKERGIDFRRLREDLRYINDIKFEKLHVNQVL